MRSKQVASHITKVKPDWKVYCIGITTNKLVKRYFVERALIVGTATDAADSSRSDSGRQKQINFAFFVVINRRRTIYPPFSAIMVFRVNEIEVYQTKEVQHTLEKVYQGILFSPSAVSSFFKSNKIRYTTILFSIGITTAEEIESLSNNKIVISDLPGKDKLVKNMMEYFLEPL
jgi:uroporphyrinogen-III synthase